MVNKDLINDNILRLREMKEMFQLKLSNPDYKDIYDDIQELINKLEKYHGK